MTKVPSHAWQHDVFVDHDVPAAPGASPSLAAAVRQLNNHHAAQPNPSSHPLHGNRTDPDHNPALSNTPMTSQDTRDAQFQTNTIAPSPPAGSSSALAADTVAASPSPSGASSALSSNSTHGTQRSNFSLQHKSSSSSLKPVSRTPSFKQAIAHAVGSNYPSPIISAMGDVTPLPSPLLSSHSPGPWKQLRARSSSRESSLPPIMHDSVLITTSGESVAAALATQSKRKVYAGLNHSQAQEQSSGKYEHTRNRSISEYIPDPRGIPKRHTTVSGPRGKGETNTDNGEKNIRREPHLSASRGLTSSTKPPTPPPSETSHCTDGSVPKPTGTGEEYFEAHGRNDRKLRRWRAIKELGQGTFSRVVLATSQVLVEGSVCKTSNDPSEMPNRRTLVAVKVCEHGPRGGASENRIEMSLKRELEIMQSISHPSLIHLKAWNIEPSRALLILSYCPGGDLFDVAAAHRESLTSRLLRRIFAEVVGAVRYLHQCHIVHRDIKLENVLVNLTPAELADQEQDWATYPYSIVTLTDLGLSRRVADDEKLETRCGSDDYAAPEVILGQPYDGRATDAWSLGVLLYALLESRLPFDPHPNASDAQRMRSRTSHRIARVEWSWIKYAGDDGDHEANTAKFEDEGLKGAMEVTEGLLKRARSRWPMDQVADNDWVQGGIHVEGGPKFMEEEEGEVVS